MAQRFIPSKPFDAFVVVDGNYHAIEYKMHKKTTAWSFNEVKEHQIQGLMDAKLKGGGEGWVFVNLRQKRVNRTFAISVIAFNIEKYQYSKYKNRKSIPVEDMIERERWVEITRTSRDKDNKLCWDTKEFFKD